ncbi:MAG: PAS domain-containing protein [Methylobacter sp.]
MQINSRQQAEAILKAKREPSVECIKALSAEALQEIFHELHVHQAELELQNEELRQTQIELDEAKTRYFELYDLAPVGYLTISEKGLITQANFAAATMLGLPRRALVNKPFSNFIDNDEQSNYYRFCKQFVESKEQQMLNLRILNHDGAPFWVHLEAVIAQNIDGIFEHRYILVDTSKLMQAEKTLVESKQDFQVLFQKSPIGIAYGKMLYHISGKPVDYRFLDVNEAYKKLSGINPQSNNIKQIFSDNEGHSVDWIATLAQIAQTGEQIHIAHFFSPAITGMTVSHARSKPINLL